MNNFLTNKPMVINVLQSVTNFTYSVLVNSEPMSNFNIELQIFNKNISNNIFAILATFKELELIHQHVSAVKINFEDNSESDLIIYHMKNFSIRISSLNDIAINLINNVYRTGISSKKISLELLKDNFFTKETDAVKHLISIQPDISLNNRLRNLIVHEGRFEDLSVDQLLEILFLRDKIDTSKYNIAALEKQITKSLTEILSFMTDKIEQMKIFFEVLFDLLESIYEEKSSEIADSQK